VGKQCVSHRWNHCHLGFNVDKQIYTLQLDANGSTRLASANQTRLVAPSGSALANFTYPHPLYVVSSANRRRIRYRPSSSLHSLFWFFQSAETQSKSESGAADKRAIQRTFSRSDNRYRSTADCAPTGDGSVVLPQAQDHPITLDSLARTFSCQSPFRR
jgi:hypothetical protein